MAEVRSRFEVESGENSCKQAYALSIRPPAVSANAINANDNRKPYPNVCVRVAIYSQLLKNCEGFHSDRPELARAKTLLVSAKTGL